MSGESELLRQQLEELRAEMESVRLVTDVKIESERVARKAAEAVAKEAIERRTEPALQQPRVQVQQAEQGYRNNTGMSLFMSQNGMLQSSLMGKRCTCGRVDSKLS